MLTIPLWNISNPRSSLRHFSLSPRATLFGKERSHGAGAVDAPKKSPAAFYKAFYFRPKKIVETTLERLSSWQMMKRRLRNNFSGTGVSAGATEVP